MQKREKRLEYFPSVRSPRKSTQGWTQTFQSTGMLREKCTNLNTRNSTRNTCQVCWNHWQVAMVVISASPNVPLSFPGNKEEWTPLSRCGWVKPCDHADQWPTSGSEVRLKHLIAGMRPSRSLPRHSASCKGGGCSVSWVPEWGQCRAESPGQIWARKKSLLF